MKEKELSPLEIGGLIIIVVILLFFPYYMIAEHSKDVKADSYYTVV